MLDISKKILDVLLKENIAKEDIEKELDIIKNDIATTLWEKMNIYPEIIYTLKDTIFYNFEYLYHSDKPTGKSNLKYFGSEYPTIMNIFSFSNYISYDNCLILEKELEKLLSLWNKDIFLARLYSKNDFDWTFGDENPTDIIIYNKDIETPAKYGYYSYNNTNYSKIFDSHNLPIKNESRIVLCSIQKMDLFKQYNILTNLLKELMDVTKKAIKNNRGIIGDFDNYNYNE